MKILVFVIACVVGPVGASSDAVIPLQGESVLFGRVTDGLGCPLSGVTVTLYPERGRAAPAATATSDRDGHYRLTPAAGVVGPAKVVAALTGFHSTETRTNLSPGAHSWDLMLTVGLLATTEPTRIKGRVADAQRRPIADATVTLQQAFYDGEAIQARTAADGSYSFEEYHRDRQQLIVSVARPGYEAQATAVILSPKQDRSKPVKVDFTLKTSDLCVETR